MLTTYLASDPSEDLDDIALFLSRVGMSLMVALEYRDVYTHQHSSRVLELADQLGRAMSLVPHELDVLRLGAAFHDIGKIGIEDHILRKPGPLDANERLIIERHPLIGAQILAEIQDSLTPELTNCVRHHHERMDGKGYPDGLRGDEIPLMSRIIAVVDCYDALISRRSYRRSFTRDDALAVIEAERGDHLDPDVVNIFLRFDTC
jgi:diguanylate cyclase